jgi:hypothetical protein
MARKARAAHKSDLITTITETITNNPRLSAAVAFQMGVLLGQVMNNREGAMNALRRGMGAAPAAFASALPTFGLFDTPAAAPRKAPRKTVRRKRRKA